MKRFFHNFRFSVLLTAILCCALGVVILIWPSKALNILCYGFGGLLALSGLLQLASYFLGDRQAPFRKLLVVTGIISVVVGAWILLAPQKILRLVGIVLGIVLLYHGVMDVKYGIDIKKCEGRGSLMYVLFGLITCGLGVLVLVDPFKAETALVVIMGISFLFDGATDIVTVCALAGAKTRFDKLNGAPPVIEMDPASVEVVESAAEDTSDDKE